MIHDGSPEEAKTSGLFSLSESMKANLMMELVPQKGNEGRRTERTEGRKLAQKLAKKADKGDTGGENRKNGQDCSEGLG